MTHRSRVVAVCLLAFAIRFAFSDLTDVLQTRPEISTPVSSFKRLQEGFFLLNKTGDPYEGSVFHEPPLMLVIAGLLNRLPSWCSLALVFALLDAFNTFLLIQIASKASASPSSPSFVSANILAGLLYALNPFSVLASIGASTTVLPNTFVFLALYFASLSYSAAKPSGALCYAYLSAASLSVAVYLCCYWIVLLPPLLLFVHRRQLVSIIVPLLTVLGNLAGFAALSTAYVGNWDWLLEVYGFQMRVQELTPNIGPLWYLFTEMFAEYLSFFEFAMQAFIFVLVVPLTMRFHHDPLVLWWLLVSIVATLRPYLSVAELGLQLGLLGLLHADYRQLEHKTLMFATAVALGVLAPIFHNMWLYTGTGNANFYFALAIVLAFLQVCLVSGVMSAALVRHYQKKLSEEN